VSAAISLKRATPQSCHAMSSNVSRKKSDNASFGKNYLSSPLAAIELNVTKRDFRFFRLH
jgi:hypothetical protein